MGNPVVAHKNNHSHSPQRNEVIGTRRLRPICSGWAARCCAIVAGAITAADVNCPLVWLSSRQVKRKQKKNSPSLLMLFLHGENIATVARRDLKFTSPEFVNNCQTTNISNDMQQNDFNMYTRVGSKPTFWLQYHNTNWWNKGCWICLRDFHIKQKFTKLITEMFLQI